MSANVYHQQYCANMQLVQQTEMDSSDLWMWGFVEKLMSHILPVIKKKL